MKRLIFMIPRHRCNHDAFTLSEANESNELPDDLKVLMRRCKRTDKVFTLDNFALCFNLSDTETQSKKYMMFVPDAKFDLSFLDK